MLFNSAIGYFILFRSFIIIHVLVFLSLYFYKMSAGYLLDISPEKGDKEGVRLENRLEKAI